MCKVATNGGYYRGSNRFNHLLQGGWRVGAGGIFYARVCNARGQALRMFAVPKYSWRERWCVATTRLRSVKYAGGTWPSVESISSCAPGVLAGVAIRCSGKGGPFGIPSKSLAEESPAEDSARSVRGGAATSQSVSRTHCASAGVP